MASDTALPLILIADDHTEDLFFLRRRLDRVGIKNPVVTFSDGDRLTAFLRAMNVRGTHEKSLRPAVLFLSLDLPSGAAFEALKWVRSDGGMRDLQVVVLADANTGPRIRRAMELGVVHFIGRRASVEAVEKIAHAAQLRVKPAAKTSHDGGKR